MDFAKDLAGDWIWGQVTVARFVLSKGQPELALEILGDHLGQVPEQWHEIRLSIRAAERASAQRRSTSV